MNKILETIMKYLGQASTYKGLFSVLAAFGVVLKPDFTPMKYNREDVYNREGYIIANKKENILL